MTTEMTKIDPEEWHASNSLQYSRAEQSRMNSQLTRDETKRILNDTQASTVRLQDETTTNLTRRIDDVAFWKIEITRSSDEIMDEINQLNTSIENLNKEINACNIPLDVSNQCLGFRSQRESIDLVHDQPERHLIKEVEIIKGVQALLNKTLDRGHEQMRILKSCKYKLNKDLEDKADALTIDQVCALLDNEAPNLSMHMGPAPIVMQPITPQLWEDFSDLNIQQSEKQRSASQILRGIIDGVISQSRNDILFHRNSTNLAFKKRIEETMDAKLNLESQFENTVLEISSVEESIADLEKAISDKATPLKVAHTRLDNRQERLRVELVRDRPQLRLENEVTQLNNNIQTLRKQLELAEASRKELYRTKLDLEEDIAVKKKSLLIDEDQCLRLRDKLSEENNS